MYYYDDRLRELKEKIDRSSRLQSVLRSLYLQRDELQAKVLRLQDSKFREQADVDKLQGRSLAAFFYNVMGKMEEKLTKEQSEAYAAAAKYDAALFELNSVESDIMDKESELEELYSCESEYDKTLREKSEEIKKSGSADGESIIELDNSIAEESSKIKEANEAISAGESAVRTADDILTVLQSAKNYGTADILLGKSFIIDAIKHEKLDNAQRKIEILQSQLRRFKTELTDVKIDADIQANTDGFLKFADFFFDDIFSSIAVTNHIDDSYSRISDVKNEISSVLSKLYSMRSGAEREKTKLMKEQEELILRAKL